MAKRQYLHFGKKLGHPPGTLIYTGRWETPFSITVVTYNTEEVSSLELDNPKDIEALISPNHQNWGIIHSLNNAEFIEYIGKKNGMSELQMEDIMSVRGLPKIDKGKIGTLVTLRRPMYTQEEGFRSEQMTLYLKDNSLLVFRELNDDFFSPLMKRLNLKGSRLRNRDTTYLLYAIIDLVVDHYLHLLDQLNEKIEDAEDIMLQNSSTEIIQNVTELKRTINLCHRFVGPTRQMVQEIRAEHDYLTQGDMHEFYSDLNDHLVQVLGQLEFMKENARDLVELHATLLNTKTNQVMTTLTILSSIFIPLTFIAGVYGINFLIMPELTWANGYYYALGLMAFIGLVMFVWMRNRKWF